MLSLCCTPQIKALHQLSLSLSQNNETSPERNKCAQTLGTTIRDLLFTTPITLKHLMTFPIYPSRYLKSECVNRKIWKKKKVRFLDSKLQTEFTF
jgi:hypothetical protein